MTRPFRIPGGNKFAIALALFPFSLTIANIYFAVIDNETGMCLGTRKSREFRVCYPLIFVNKREEKRDN